jgi:hypothetical protein
LGSKGQFFLAEESAPVLGALFRWKNLGVVFRRIVAVLLGFLRKVGDWCGSFVVNLW